MTTARTLLLAALLAVPAPSRAEAPPAEPGPAVRPEQPATVAPGYLEGRWAATDLSRLAQDVRAWHAAHGSWPSPCPGPAATGATRDPWGQPYACVLDDGRPRLVSAGPDGVAGTPDDVVRDVADTRPDAAPEPRTVPASSASSGAAVASAPVAPEVAATVAALHRAARALEAFRAAHGHYPVTDRPDQLGRWLAPEHLAPADWSAEDGWGNAWRYRTTDVGAAYTLASAGADRRWEAVAPLQPGPLDSADADLLVVDGELVRWTRGVQPFHVRPGSAPAAAPGTPSAAAPEAAAPEPADPHAATEQRLLRLFRVIAAERERTGRHPESDDAPRVLRELGSTASAVDAWGREVDYLSFARGAHAVLVSRGADGRAARTVEAYARGAAAAGDDVVVRDGKLVPYASAAP